MASACAPRRGAAAGEGTICRTPPPRTSATTRKRPTRSPLPVSPTKAPQKRLTVSHPGNAPWRPSPRPSPSTSSTPMASRPSRPSRVRPNLPLRRHRPVRRRQRPRWFGRSPATTRLGRFQPVGEGDVHVCPSLDQDGNAILVVDLHSPYGAALLHAPARDVNEFVDRTTISVRPGHREPPSWTSTPRSPPCWWVPRPTEPARLLGPGPRLSRARPEVFRGMARQRGGPGGEPSPGECPLAPLGWCRPFRSPPRAHRGVHRGCRRTRDFDLRGNPTVEVEVALDDGTASRAAVPSGASTGASRRSTCATAASSMAARVSRRPSPVLDKIGPSSSASRRRSSGWSTSACSSSTAATTRRSSVRTRSSASRWPWPVPRPTSPASLFRYVGGPNAHVLPVLMMNILNGGAQRRHRRDRPGVHDRPGRRPHLPRGAAPGRGGLPRAQVGAQRGLATGLGDEGGFALDLPSNREALDLIVAAVESTGQKVGEDVVFALDVAATEFYSDGGYQFEGSAKSPSRCSPTTATWSRRTRSSRSRTR